MGEMSFNGGRDEGESAADTGPVQIFVSGLGV
jgi:hypothetical protein